MHQAMDKNGISTWTKSALAPVDAGGYPATAGFTLAQQRHPQRAHVVAQPFDPKNR